MDPHVAAIREFNRFYTGVIGVLQAGMHDTSYSLTEARVLYELGRRDRMDAADLRLLLDLDGGYLSRMLARMEQDGLLSRERSESDARRQVVALTAAGRDVAAMLDARAVSHLEDVLAELSTEDRARLVSAMAVIRRLLGGPRQAAPYVIRPPRAGDLGWVVYRHGVLYAQEYGWGREFEGLVAGVVGGFATRYDPAREACWIAEVDGERVGCLFCVRHEEPETAQLRLLLVEPSARGMGIGGRLVGECLRFAREAGYRRITLWTRAELTGARRIYRNAGFELIEQHEGQESGRKVVDEIWARAL
ncbi:MarR family transcriptional regulator [Microtetraspora sp. NBRC 13810]|uniref:bifunctional helix-turn-helix transcriptional regulator/GNAT family N-acetyltransferase n=1 Tax=Microtetraspora sp. NBRC 13810 TaxID=3030990 RepID=UPI0024A1BDD1|nr:helix-turn-helix domain-containing GNAT family N-acetyltransferase [Microtetraspora sp. NBRC 13810]GLW12080.1 MarR family transcriptional regulator [Microtetraspora sp. NBRC 13810]